MLYCQPYCRRAVSSRQARQQNGQALTGSWDHSNIGLVFCYNKITQMFNTEELSNLRKAIAEVARADRDRLQALRAQVRQLRAEVRPIRPRNTTAVSLVAADAGENAIRFNPFVIQPVRVVDSYGQVHFLDVLSPFTDPAALSARHLSSGTPLGQLMADLGV